MPQGEFRTVDLHGDILLDVLERRRFYGEQQVLLTRHAAGLREGRVKVQVLPIYVEARYQPEGSLRHVMLAIDALYRELEESGGRFRFVRDTQSLEDVLASDDIGVILAFEGAEAFGRDVGLASLFYELGLRMAGLTWNRTNLIAQGAGEDTGAGLTPVGKALVAELGRLGVMLDVSHLNERSFWDVLETSPGPILASHSNAVAIWQHPRNLTDAQVKALIARGGIIGVNFVVRFIGPGDPIDKLVDHTMHMASLVGVGSLAVGADFIDYIQYMGQREPQSIRLPSAQVPDPPERPNVRWLPRFWEALLRRGFSEDEARGIMAENALRFMREHLPDANRGTYLTAAARASGMK